MKIVVSYYNDSRTIIIITICISNKNIGGYDG